ncbi:MAG TPA: nucleotide exchange factor GrpE [Candidatus Limnocylindria bacterium]|nr:nucleotide exchange factor GrpE [Candidatus Limnocylindria bacterium]
MDRPQTRAQQRAHAIDVSPAKLAAEIERITRERDLARRQVELAREELAKLLLTGAATAAASGGKGGKAPKGPSADELAKERDEYLTALQRERAEFTNFRRRTAEEREAMLGLAAEGLIRKVLALADDFDLAVSHRPAAGLDDAWVEGITAIDRKLRQLLESEGVTRVEAAPGVEFDPREHEAVANVPNTGRPGGEIVDVLRPGYRLRDRVIRPALVAVAEDSFAIAEDGEPSEPSEPIH